MEAGKRRARARAPALAEGGGPRGGRGLRVAPSPSLRSLGFLSAGLGGRSLPRSWASIPSSLLPSLRSPYWRISFSIRLSSHDWKSVSFMPSAVMSSSSCDPCSSDSVASPSGEESCSTWAMYFCWGKRGGTAERR